MAEWQQLLVLVAALTATVLSWDGYLVSIAERPLKNFWRFAIDIFLVFLYMVLLMTSKLLTWWLFLHAFTFALYVVWDFLTVWDWKEKYYYVAPDSARQTIGRIYIGGLMDSAEVSRGPVITIVWALYFWVLWLLYWFYVPTLRDRITGTTVLVVLGLWLYRRDKTYRFTMCRRVATAALLLLAAVAYLTWIPTDEAAWSSVGQYIGSASCAQ